MTLAGKHSLIVVEHDMDFVDAHRAQGYRAARRAACSPKAMDKVQSDPRVIEVYLGR